MRARVRRCTARTVCVMSVVLPFRPGASCQRSMMRFCLSSMAMPMLVGVSSMHSASAGRQHDRMCQCGSDQQLVAAACWRHQRWQTTWMHPHAANVPILARCTSHCRHGVRPTS